MDHIEPESLGGVSKEYNLAAACAICNNRKSNVQTVVDPLTNEVVPLFNPRTQIWREHFKWSEDGTRLIGLTSIGRATVEKLQINREITVRERKRWVEVGWHPPKLD